MTDPLGLLDDNIGKDPLGLLGDTIPKPPVPEPTGVIAGVSAEDRASPNLYGVKGAISAVGETLKNVPKSLVNYFGSMIKTFTDWKDIGENLGNIITDDNNARDKAIEGLKQRYGSIENLNKTIIQDPAGFLGDLSAVVGTSGGIIKGIGALGSAESIGNLGNAVTKTGGLLEPMNVAKSAVTLPSKIIPETTLNSLYVKGAKFSTVLDVKDRAKLAETARHNDILTTVNGVEKTQMKIEELKSQIGDMVDTASAANQPVPLKDLFAGFDDLREKLRLTGKPIQNMAALDNIKEQILDANRAIGRNELTVAQVQKLKQNIYRDLGDVWEQFNNSPASVQAQKSVSNTARNIIEQFVPEVKQLNADEGALIELRDAITRSANRIQNRDLVGIGTPMKAMAGNVVSEAHGGLWGLAIGVLDAPLVKEKLANVLTRLKDQGIKVRPTLTGVRLGLYESERLGETVKTEQPQ